MPLTIRYTDTRNQHQVECDEIQSQAIINAIKAYLHPPLLVKSEFHDFDLMHIDLRDESIEQVYCYRKVDSVITQGHIAGARVCSFGGAIAWNIYRQIAEIWPEINYHTSGRPAVIL